MLTTDQNCELFNRWHKGQIATNITYTYLHTRIYLFDKQQRFYGVPYSRKAEGTYVRLHGTKP